MAKAKFDFYDKQNLLKIEGWARDGWEDKQIAENLRYNETYFSELKSKIPELSEALKRGRQPLDIIVENSLYKRATGLKVKTVIKRWLLLPDGTKTDTEILQETESEIPPDTGAAMAWLKNRKPESWNKEPIRVDTTSKGKQFMPARTLTKAQAVELMKDLNEGKFSEV